MIVCGVEVERCGARVVLLSTSSRFLARSRGRSGSGSSSTVRRVSRNVNSNRLSLHPHPERHLLLALVVRVLGEHVGRKVGSISASPHCGLLGTEHVMQADKVRE